LSRVPKERTDVTDHNPIDVKELVDDALPAQSPPTALRGDVLVAAGRRSRRRRRVAVAGVAVAAVAVLGGVAGAAQFLPVARGHQVRPGASAAPSLTYDPKIPPAARLTTALRKQVKGFLPTATLAAYDTGALQDVEPLGFVMRQHTWYEAGAAITLGGGVGGLDIGVDPDGTNVSQGACGTVPMAAGDGCTTMTVAGTTLHKHTHTYSTGAQSVRVEGLLTNHTYIWIDVFNYNPASVLAEKNPPPPVPQMNGQPLTADQQAAIVTNPALATS
jgi:hypothetical protein